MTPLDHWLLLGSILLLVSIFASKISDRFGVPALLLFLGIGMLAGSGGPGGIEFTNARLAQGAGLIALVFILFASALQTHSKEARPILGMAVSLSTLGVLLSAVIVGALTRSLFGFSWTEGVLLGAIVSATDAAAVFSVLRSRRVSLKPPIKPLLELESGSNDPMAVVLTLGCIGLLTVRTTPSSLPLFFLTQFGVGALVGVFSGKGMLFILRRLKLQYEGLYPALALALILFTYSLAALLRGNGFLAVYISGLLLAGSDFYHKKSLTRFLDGLAWLTQITMFLILGLLVLPSHILGVLGPGLLMAAFLVLVARPASVFVSLLGSRFSSREKAMISWAGLRGAAPIILATFPLVARIQHADLYFNLVFFIVLVSVLVQGPTISWVARLLGVEVPLQERKRSPLEFDAYEAINARLEEFILPFNSAAAGMSLTQLGLPPDCLISLICRNDEYLIPSGRTTLEEGDVISVLGSSESLAQVQSILSRQMSDRKETA